MFWYFIPSFVYSSLSISFPVFYGLQWIQCFFFCLSQMVQTQVHTKNRALPSTTININEHYPLVNFLLSYSHLVSFLLLYSHCFCFSLIFLTIFFLFFFRIFHILILIKHMHWKCTLLGFVRTTPNMYNNHKQHIIVFISLKSHIQSIISFIEGMSF